MQSSNDGVFILDPASGKVASYTVYYVTVTQEQAAAPGFCAGLDPATPGTPVAVQPSPVATPGTVETASVQLAGSDKMPACFAAIATDAVGNSSARQPFVLA